MKSINALLGLPEEEQLRAIVLQAAKGEEGITARQLHKRYPRVGLLVWFEALASANRAGLLTHAWTPCPAGSTALQQGLYAIAPTRPG